MGFPASAGIDPLLAYLSYMVERLPRECGDRPRLPGPAAFGNRASPRVRG